MTEGGEGGSGKPPDRPARPDPADEAMYRSASSAGWDDPMAKAGAPPATAARPDAAAPAAPPPAAPAPGASAASPSPASPSPASPPPAAIAKPPAPAGPLPAVTGPSAAAGTPPAASAGVGAPAPKIRSTPPLGVSFPVFVPSSAKPSPTAPAASAPGAPSGATAGDRAPPDAGAGPRAQAQGDAEDDGADPDEPRPGGRSLRAILLAAVLVIGAAGIAVFALMGYLNSDRYVLACEPDRAVPEQGRGVPPWGTRALTGAAWRPVKIAPETRCQPHETDDVLVLQRLFLAMVLDQATALLTAREVNRVDDAEALLQQALLLTRPAEHEPEALAQTRGEQHQEIERLLGDVAYWHGQAKVRDALSALGDAARQFDTAVARHPRHVSDAAAWAVRVRTLADDLRAGSASTAAGPVAPPPAPPSPAPSPTPAATAGSAGHPAVPPTTATAPVPAEIDRSAHPSPPAAPPPDAGPPTGVLL